MISDSKTFSQFSNLLNEEEVNSFSFQKVKPSDKFRNFIFQEQPIFGRSYQELTCKISLIDLHQKTRRPKEGFYLVGSNLLHALGEGAVINLLSQIKIKDSSLYEILGSSINSFIQWRCAREGNDFDFRVKKKERSRFSDLTRLDSYLSNQSSIPSKWFKKYFYCDRFERTESDDCWCIQSFYYGEEKKRVELIQELKFKDRSFIFYESALLLQIFDDGEVLLTAPPKVNVVACFLQHLFGVLKIPRQGIRKPKDFEMLVIKLSRFMYTTTLFEEEELPKQVEDSFALVGLLKDGFEKHTNHSASAWLSLTLNTLRIWRKEEEFIRKELLTFSFYKEEDSWMNVLFEMIQKEVPYALISAWVVAAAQMKIIPSTIRKHNGIDFLVIGEKYSIYFALDSQVHAEVLDGFDLLLPYFERMYTNKTRPFMNVYFKHILEGDELFFQKQNKLFLKISQQWPAQQKLEWYLEFLKNPLNLAFLEPLKELLQSENPLKGTIPYSICLLFKHDPQGLNLYQTLLKKKLIALNTQLNGLWMSIFEQQKKNKEPKELYSLWKDQYLFHKARNLSLTGLEKEGLDLFNLLKKDNHNLAIELRSLVKKEQALQKKMVIEDKIAKTPEISKKTVTSKTLSIEELNELLKDKKSIVSLSDSQLAKFLSENAVQNWRPILWKKLKDVLPKYKQSLSVLEKWQEEVLEHVHNSSDLEMVDCLPKAKELFLQIAFKWRETNISFSQLAFERVLSCKGGKLKEDLLPLLLCYRDGKSRVWLYGLKNSVLLAKSFNLSEELLKTALDIDLTVCDKEVLKKLNPILKEKFFFKIPLALDLRYAIALKLNDPAQMIALMATIIQLETWRPSDYEYFFELLDKLQQLKAPIPYEMLMNIFLISNLLINFLQENKNINYISSFFLFASMHPSQELLETAIEMLFYVQAEKNTFLLSKERRAQCVDCLQKRIRNKKDLIALFQSRSILRIFPIEDVDFFNLLKPKIFALLQASFTDQHKKMIWKNFFERLVFVKNNLKMSFKEGPALEQLAAETFFELIMQFSIPPISHGLLIRGVEDILECRKDYLDSGFSHSFLLLSFLKQIRNPTQYNPFEQRVDTLFKYLLNQVFLDLSEMIEKEGCGEECIDICYEWTLTQFNFQNYTSFYSLNYLMNGFNCLLNKNKIKKENSKLIAIFLIARALRKNQDTTTYPRFMDLDRPFTDHDSGFLDSMDGKLLCSVHFELLQQLGPINTPFAQQFAISIADYGFLAISKEENYIDKLCSIWFADLDKMLLPKFFRQCSLQFFLGNKTSYENSNNQEVVNEGLQVAQKALYYFKICIQKHLKKQSEENVIAISHCSSSCEDTLSLMGGVDCYKNSENYPKFLKLVMSYIEIFLLFSKTNPLIMNLSLINYVFEHLINDCPEECKEARALFIRTWWNYFQERKVMTEALGVLFTDLARKLGVELK